MSDGKPAERNQENMDAIRAELDTCPSLDPYEYQKWDSETLDFVNGILRQYLSPGSSSILWLILLLLKRKRRQLQRL